MISRHLAGARRRTTCQTRRAARARGRWLGRRRRWAWWFIRRAGPRLAGLHGVDREDLHRAPTNRALGVDRGVADFDPFAGLGDLLGLPINREPDLALQHLSPHRAGMAVAAGLEA